MVKYDYTALNDKEFEELVGDLMNREYNLGLQSFKKGKDKGIDLRYASEGNENAIIVQVKQYTSTFKVLFANLKSKEFKKVKKLSPAQYWVVTCLPLSAQEKDLIATLFDGYMTSADCVLGYDDLNRLLRKYKDIEKSWIKLWLTNTTVLNRVLNNAIAGRSEFYRERIISRIKLYVKSRSLADAGEMLKKNRFLLISGQPGVGKTTLADILTYEFLAQKFQLVYVDKNIEEAGDLFEGENRDLKQLIYFDDFLGANRLEIETLQSSESAIVRFIDRVQASKNKYMILTTRTTVLRDARENYEKLNRSNIDLSNRQLVLTDYSTEDKGRILYNHLFHSSIEANRKKEIFRNKNYWKIIDHKNYTPRLIEFFTTRYNLEGIPDGVYLDFVMRNLHNPKEIWRHSYTKQLHAEDRFLVGTLYSFGNMFRYEHYHFDSSVDLIPLRQGYESRLRYEVKENGFIRSNDSFNASLKRLLDGYVHSTVDRDKNTRLSFINPSINDFLTHYFKGSREEAWRVIYGCYFIHQIKYCYEQFINYLDGDQYDSESLSLVQYATARGNTLLPTVHIGAYNEMPEESAYHCEMAALLFKIRYSDEVLIHNAPLIVEHLGQIIYEQINGTCYDMLVEIFDEADEDSLVYQFILNNWEKLIINLWPHTRHEDELEKIERLFAKYGKSMAVFMFSAKNQEIVKEVLAEFVHDETSTWISQDEDELEDDGDIGDLKETVRKRRADIYGRFHLKDTDYDEYHYFADVSLERSAERRASRGAVVNLPDKVKDQAKPAADEEAKRIVDELFVT
ncbi:restriction endonuclease [Pedobacter soli]|uniref:Adenylate kinase n=1 Tax=Pedobacter soli TaxID=390242 RepID=A0A1G7AUE6_9SPHI|nr:restriction endonuclease [Pedobacter soli]SDE17625.1 Adenylate kinase [Pedobacter soli]